MSYVNFPKILYIKTINTAEDILLGGVKFSEHQELGHIKLHIFIESITPTIEQMKLEVHRNAACTMKYCESNTINLSDISNPSSRWIGTVMFDFNRQNINKNLYWYLKLIITNYTRGAGYIGVMYDWPDKTNANSNLNPLARALKFECIGYK